MSRQRFVVNLFALILLWSPALAQAPVLPEAAPAPETSPIAEEPAPEAPAEPPAIAPLPEERPETADTTEQQPQPETAKSVSPAPLQGPPVPAELAVVPNQAPVPEERPDEPIEQAVKTGPKPLQGPPLPTELIGAMPEAEKACRVELETLEVAFEDGEAQSGEDGCLMPYPVSVSAFGQVAVEPPVTVNCAIAKTTATFLRDHVAPAAKDLLKTEVKALANGSGYVCRARTSSQKLSEHALGNAIDIMSFVFADDRRLDVAATEDTQDAAFLARVRMEACGPFKTVLGPGSDAEHANHFHLDLAERRGDATFCQ